MINEENTPPIYVLLPTCVEMKTNIFHDILSSVVYHSRLEDSLFVRSVISGMKGEKFKIDSSDLIADWKTVSLNLRQIRQYKLLGYWAAVNYPLIGKKLIGSAYKPPKECNVEMLESIQMPEVDIEKCVSKKMKLQIIELSVTKGTTKKLKCFVPVPMCVGKTNGERISSKIKKYDICSQYLPACWQALKAGAFPADFGVIIS